MKISHDKESGAVYIRLREGVSDHTEGLSEKADVYVDVDSNGIVLGLEALSFDDLAQVIDESGGELDVSLVNGVLGTPKLGAEMEAIEKALDELPKKEKQTIYLLYFQDVHVEEAASYLAVTPREVSVFHARALRRLREKLSRISGHEDFDSDTLRTALHTAS